MHPDCSCSATYLSWGEKLGGWAGGRGCGRDGESKSREGEPIIEGPSLEVSVGEEEEGRELGRVLFGGTGLDGLPDLYRRIATNQIRGTRMRMSARVEGEMRDSDT